MASYCNSGFSTFATADARLGARDGVGVARNSRLERRGPDAIAYKYHQTDIVTLHRDGRLVLNSGGWRTVSTKERMARCLPAGCGLWQEKGAWFIGIGPDWDTRHQQAVRFADGLTIHKNGRITGGETQRAAKTRDRQRAKIVAYAKAYVNALETRHISGPNGGDCWYCLMFDRDGTGDRAHLDEHLKEQYYVPSLLVNALNAYGASHYMRWWVDRHWNPTSEAPRAGNERSRVLKVLTKYLLRAYGYAS